MKRISNQNSRKHFSIESGTRFFRKNKENGSSSVDGVGGDQSSSPLPPSSSTLLSPTPHPLSLTPPPPRKTNTVVEFKLVEDIRLVTIPVSACLLFLTFYIILGTMLFSMWEGWSYLDGAYFCFTSLMTIGFGDFVPGKGWMHCRVYQTFFRIWAGFHQILPDL